ncbi:MAG TPA: hypothetical protein VFK89_04265 [Actinomycetota bacterium]|nr:hypothetical protein [Actinomycetota bacterium]
MSVLLVVPDSALGRSIAARLVQQGDEVRAIEAETAAGSALADLGVHVGRGPYLDADLIERAGQNCRTVVVIDQSEAALSEVVSGMRAARIPRLIVCADRIAPQILEVVTGSGLEYVILRSPRGLLRRGPSDDEIAEAVDAADDLAGELKLDLDLGEAGAWTALGLERA